MIVARRTYAALVLAPAWGTAMIALAVVLERLS